MRVLVACEFSGIVRDAFAARGHDAWSCDWLPTERPGNHFERSVFEIIDDGWDVMIAFPPCTHLASSGAQYWPAKQLDGSQRAAITFIHKLYYSDIPRVAIENPVGILSTEWRQPDQIIQPYYFGDPYTKKTCLWLKGLPLLSYAIRDTLFESKTAVEPLAAWGSNSYRGGLRKDGTRKVNKLPVLHGDSKKRSESFPGIARAMAEQWG